MDVNYIHTIHDNEVQLYNRYLLFLLYYSVYTVVDVAIALRR
jgi:hypothetical protein